MPYDDQNGSVSDDVYLSAYRFLSTEAGLLDRRAYKEWLELLTDDVHYRVTAQVSQDAAECAKDFAIIDEDTTALRARVEQIATPKLTHAENPPSLARRFFSGLSVERGNQPSELVARANVMIFRTKPELADGGLYVGSREDMLRKVEGRWRLARRFVRLDHSILYGCVSVIF
jgi:3-phenylpropionate/cinnamic acid dioxygenase small subunit